MRRKASWIALLLALGLVAAACGGDEEVELGDLSGQSIEVGVIWAGAEQQNFERVTQLFEQETGAEVTVTSAGDDLPVVLGTRLAGGNPPDVALIAQPGVLKDFVRRGVLVDVEQDVGALVDANYSPSWRQLATVDGKLYGVWFKGDNKSTLWYNVDVFEQAGVTLPKTWDELKAAAQTIADFGVPPFSLGGADGWTLTDWFENVYLRTAGGEKYDQLSNHEIPWTDQSVKDALRTLAEVFGKTDWLLGGRAGATQTNFDNSVPPAFSDPPKASMVHPAFFVSDVIKANTKAQLGVDANFFDFPSIGGSPPAVMGSGNVAILFKDTEAGRAFLKFLASPEAAEVWARLGGFTSPNRKVDLAGYPDELTRKAGQALAQAETFRFDLSDLQPAAFGATAGQGMWGIMQDYLRNPSDIDGIAQKLEAAAAAAFA